MEPVPVSSREMTQGCECQGGPWASPEGKCFLECGLGQLTTCWAVDCMRSRICTLPKCHRGPGPNN